MKELGFGFLRLPQAENGEVDFGQTARLVDAFLAGGGRYFDTAYTYLGGKSEEAIRFCLVSRYPRDRFCLADKLPSWLVKTEADCEAFFREQCRRCGVEWFDVYLLHWLNPENYAIARTHREFEFLQGLKAAGKAKRTGFSYHGDAALLDRILTEHPEVDLVQLQINYLDWEDPAIEAGKCYETALRHGKQIIVMEPVKGGTLAQLPQEGEALLRAHTPDRSPASWAIGFAQSQPGVQVVLSGMNALAQIQDNLRPWPDLDQQQLTILAQVRQILNKNIAVGCTGCRYCVAHCPQGIPIPDYFSIYNSYCRQPGEQWKIQPVYQALAQGTAPASGCIGCGACTANCPQRIPIPHFMKEISSVLE